MNYKCKNISNYNPEDRTEQSDKVQFDRANLAKSVSIVHSHSLTLLDFLRGDCGLVNIIYVGLMPPPRSVDVVPA